MRAQTLDRGGWRDGLQLLLLVALLYAGIFWARDIQELVAASVGRAAFLFATVLAVGVAGVFAMWSTKGRPLARFAVIWVAGLYLCGAWYLRRDPEEALHFVEYGAVSFLAFRFLRHVQRDALVFPSAALLSGIFGMMDEFIQYYAPGRFFDFRDLFINVAAALMMQGLLIAVAGPEFRSMGVTKRSVWIASGLGWAALAILFACFSNTPQREARMRALGWPVAGRKDESMVEYGHRHEGASGLVWYSRLTVGEVRERDLRDGERVGALLDSFSGTNGYKRFMKEVAPIDDPFAYEARVRLFRRDKFAREAMALRRSPEKARYAATIALREGELAASLYSNTLAHMTTGEIPADWTPIIASLADASSPYESPVSNQLLTRFSERGIRSILFVVAVVIASLAFLRLRTPIA